MPTHLRHSRALELLLRLGVATPLGHRLITSLISRWLTKPTLGKMRRTPADLGLPWDPLTCMTADNVRLAGWLVEPPTARATVVLCHAIRHNREQTLSRIAFLAAAGYRCVAFDHRAHGESAGRRTSFGHFESLDVSAALDLTHARWPGQPVAALGMSMGGAALCCAAEHTRRCQAVILENMYFDVVSAFTNRLTPRHPPTLRRLTPALVRACERLFAVEGVELSPSDRIADLAPAPILLVTGQNDQHAPPAEAEQMFERRRGPGELFIVPGAGHNDVCEKGGRAYEERILGFLERWLFGADHITYGKAA